MKKIFKISILVIIFYLCIVSYGYTKAENEVEQNSQQEVESNGNTETTQNEENKQEQTKTNTSNENSSESSNTSTEPSSSENLTPSENTDSSEEPKPLENETSAEEQNKPETEENSQSNQQQSSQTKNSQPTSNARENKPAQTRVQSNNANLSELGITPNDFKGFRAAILEYSVTVPNDIEKVNVYAKAQDANAKITSGIGDQNLNVGENNLQVVVTAENGDVKTYTIKVTREEKAEEENKVPENVPVPDLKKLEVKGYKLTPSFSANVYEYKLNIKQDVDELEIITEKQNDKVSIEVVGNTDLKERRKYNYYFSKK